MEDPPVTDFVRSDLLALLSEQARFNFRLLIALNEGKRVPDEAIDQLVSGVGEIFGRQMRMLRSSRGAGDEL
jgi:hypothetical protein